MKMWVGLLLLCLTGIRAVAQQMPSIPVDKDVRVGKLENGLTYYIRHNELPEHRADFYIAQKVGSILEEENQRGLAHFLEHMCFNGTKHFPGNELIRYLESVGVKFGENLNAYTSIDQTVYNICNVPTYREGVQDSCLLILHDWANDLLLEGEEIDKERGVIHEEWRSSTGAMMRMYERCLPVLYPGCKYGVRLPIGIMDVVDNFPYQALRDYYEKWYRPDLQGIIVVGDVDVDRIEAQIKAIFSDIEMPENAAERTYEAVPDTPEALYAVESDKEQQHTIVALDFKGEAFPREMKGNAMYLVNDYVENVIAMMLNQRFSELSQKADAPFVGAGCEVGDYIISKTKSAFNLSAYAKPGQADSTLASLLREALRVREFGFTATEYERARQEYMSQLDKYYSNRDKMKNEQFVETYVNHFLDNEPMPSVADYYMLMSQIVPNVPLELINQGMKELVSATDSNMVVMVFTPEKEGSVKPTIDELKQTVAAVRAEKIEAYVDNVKNEPLMTELPEAGRIVEEREDAGLGTKIWKLSNGIKVISKKTDFKNDEVLMSSFSKGGKSKVDNSQLENLKMLGDVVGITGLGNFKRTELSKALSGKQASVRVTFGELYEYVSGNCVPKDLETLFQLTYLTFTAPLRDQEAFDALMNRSRATLANRDAQPTTAFSDTLRAVVYDRNPRVKSMELKDLDRVNYDEILAIYKDRMLDAGDFTFIFTGNFDEAKLREYCELYLASLPATGRNEEYEDRQIDFASGVVKNTFSRKMENPQAYVAVIQSGKCENTIQNELCVDIVGQVLTMIYLEKIREEAGATYSVGTNGSLQAGIDTEFVLETVCPIKPETKDMVMTTLVETLENLGKNGIEAKYFDKVKEHLQKQLAENLHENNYWSSIIQSKERDNLDYLADYPKVLEATTAETVQKFINEVILKQNNRVEVVMMPE